MGAVVGMEGGEENIEIHGHDRTHSAPEHDAPQRVRGARARSPHKQDKYDKIPQHATRDRSAHMR